MEYRGRGVIGYNHMFVEFLVALMYSEVRREGSKKDGEWVILSYRVDQI